MIQQAQQFFSTIPFSPASQNVIHTNFQRPMRKYIYVANINFTDLSGNITSKKEKYAQTFNDSYELA